MPEPNPYQPITYRTHYHCYLNGRQSGFFLPKSSPEENKESLKSICVPGKDRLLISVDGTLHLDFRDGKRSEAIWEPNEINEGEETYSSWDAQLYFDSPEAVYKLAQMLGDLIFQMNQKRPSYDSQY